MKSPTTPKFFHQLLKPTHGKNYYRSSLDNTLVVSHLFHTITAFSSSSSSSFFLVSPEKTTKFASCDVISPQKSHKEEDDCINNVLSTNISSEKHPKTQSIHTLLLNSSNKSKPIFRKHIFGPRAQQLHQKRLFSAEKVNVNGAVSPPFESEGSSSLPIDAGSSIRKPISLWPGMYHSPVTNALWEARSNLFVKPSNNEAADAPPQSELITKTPSKSRTCIVYKFSSDYVLREQYRNPWNEIRMGKLLEDLDALAGTISFKVPKSVCYLLTYLGVYCKNIH